MTVGELGARMTSAEFSEWAAYYREYGFDADRVEHAAANAGAAVCQSFGAKVKAGQLVPRFGPRGETNVLAVRLWLETLTPDRFWK
jgi:hypothetical protein